MRNEFDNDASWRRSLNGMFRSFHMENCTPGKILEVMRGMKRTANKVEDITIAARCDNIAASDETVLDCLRSLYREGRIEHRNIGSMHWFLVKK